MLKSYWRCGDCDEIYDDEEDARDCCAPTIHECFRCAVCNLPHDDEDDAVSCCGSDLENLPEARPTAEELERHGQLRLEDI